MNIAIITGTSSGLGKAIAEALLETGKWKVTGISRSNNIFHPNYTHQSIDLSDPSQWDNVNWHSGEDVQKAVLINNSAKAHPINYIGNLSKDDIVHNVLLNLGAPFMMMDKFVKAYAVKEIVEKLIINISTGAAQKPIDGLGLYCSTKAGLDMASRVLAQENELNSINCQVFAIAPGIVDTGMQDEIRSSDPGNFSRKNEFVSFKTEGKLASPKEVAQKYLKIIENPENFRDIVFPISNVL